jgi:hypothetical protein
MESRDGPESDRRKWEAGSGRVEEKYGNLTDDNLTEISGRRDPLEGLPLRAQCRRERRGPKRIRQLVCDDIAARGKAGVFDRFGILCRTS